MGSYWQRHKVFLYGQAALFPEKLEKRAMSADELSRYFGTDVADDLMTELRKCEQNGYFKVEITLAESGKAKQLQAKLTNIDKHKFYDELEPYLEEYHNDRLTTDEPTKPESFTNQRDKLVRATAGDYPRHQFTPIVARHAIWGHNPDHDTFWELILSHQLITGDIWIVNMGYDHNVGRIAPGVFSTNIGTPPYAEFRVESDEFKRRVLPRKTAQADHTLGGLVVGSDNRVRLNGKDLELRSQLRHICRLLVAKSPEILLLDELLSSADIIDPKKAPKNPRQNVQKYVSELREALGSEFVIKSDAQEGYKLLLRSDVKSE